MTEPGLLHLMRHGEPVLTGRMLGRTDCPVTPQGIAACVAQVADLEPAAVVTSDLDRAARCACAIAEARGVQATSDPRWRELDFGAWDGLAPDAIDTGALSRFWADPDRCPPPDGERWSALTARVGAAITAVEPDTLVVTHAGAIRAALAVTCGLSTTQVWAFDLPYAVLVTLRLWRGESPAAQIVRIHP